MDVERRVEAAGIDPAAVSDLDVLQRFSDPLAEWWIDTFGEYVSENDGLFTPPQRQAIPHIDSDTNTLICAPTGSGKCIRPDTPVLVHRNGHATVMDGHQLMETATRPLATVDDTGLLCASDVAVSSLAHTADAVSQHPAMVYIESYDGPLIRLETACGRSVEVTPAHPLLVDADGHTEWRAAGTLHEQDRIGVPSHVDLPTDPYPLSVTPAIDTLRHQYRTVCIRADATAACDQLTNAETLADLSPAAYHHALAIADFSPASLAHQLDTTPKALQTAVTADQTDAPWAQTAVARLEAAASIPPSETLIISDSMGEYRQYQYPTQVTPAVAQLVGAVAAVGTEHRSAAGHLTRIRLANGDQASTDDVITAALRTCFGITDRDTEQAIIDPVALSFLDTVFTPETAVGQATPLPEWALNVPTESKRRLLGTLFALAGTRTADAWQLSCESAPRREQLTYLLLSLDVFPTIDHDTAEAGTLSVPVTPVDRWVQTVAGYQAPHLTARPDGGTASQTALDHAHSPSAVQWTRITNIVEVPYTGPIIDLSVPETHNFVGGTGGLFLHNTLASFSMIIDDLIQREQTTGLDNSVYCLYVSPLKSLANDIHRNLTQPLSEIEATADDLGIRHAIRHGDTDDSERQRMLRETPHILNTTPETLAILLNSPKFREKLRTVEYVIVDEIHALAESKRGTHLSVSLERLEALANGSPTRIGCSATIEPLRDVGEFLVGRTSPGGPSRPFEVVDTRFAREFDLQLYCPTDDLINTPPGVVTDQFYQRLHALIQEHTNTIVFANTRSGAERMLHNLREQYGYDDTNSGCHHGSLSKAQRERIESGLKAGELDVVTSSTSLALGIDMPHVDLVVQVGSPKSVAELLQRVGRAGHRVGETVTGRVIALDRDELVECAVMIKKAADGFVDAVSIPERAQDVAAQHVYGMAIADLRPEREIKAILRQAYPYRDYSDAEFEQLMRYLTAAYDGLEDRDVYAKVWRDTNDPPSGDHHHEKYPVGEPLIGKRGRLARMIYMTNIGTIPDSFSVDVFTRANDDWVGTLDEEYLDTLEQGDVFVLGGDRFEYRYRRGSKVYVDPTGARPTVPSWYSERLPLSFDLGREILRFQQQILDRLIADGPTAVRRWLREFPLDDRSVRALTRLYDAQQRYAGAESLSTPDRMVIEVERDRDEYRRHYHVRTLYGRRFNDGFSRLLAYYCAQETNANISVAVADNGFTLTMPLNRKVDLQRLVETIDPTAVRGDLRASLDGTDLLKRYFRINATRSLMILKRYKGHEKSASQQQVSSEMLLSFAQELEDFAVIEETYREILEDKLNVAAIEWFCQRVQADDVTVTTQTLDTPSPRSFGLATLAASDVVLAEDESAVLQEFHQRVMEELGDHESTTDSSPVGE